MNHSVSCLFSFDFFCWHWNFKSSLSMSVYHHASKKSPVELSFFLVVVVVSCILFHNCRYWPICFHRDDLHDVFVGFLFLTDSICCCYCLSNNDRTIYDTRINIVPLHHTREMNCFLFSDILFVEIDILFELRFVFLSTDCCCFHLGFVFLRCFQWQQQLESSMYFNEMMIVLRKKGEAYWICIDYIDILFTTVVDFTCVSISKLTTTTTMNFSFSNNKIEWDLLVYMWLGIEQSICCCSIDFSSMKFLIFIFARSSCSRMRASHERKDDVYVCVCARSLSTRMDRWWYRYLFKRN